MTNIPEIVGYWTSPTADGISFFVPTVVTNTTVCHPYQSLKTEVVDDIIKRKIKLTAIGAPVGGAE